MCAAGSTGGAALGAWTNWFTDAATFFDWSGAVGLWLNAWAAAINNCVASSGLPGPAGNLETFVWLAAPGSAGGLDDVEAAAREVEP